MLQQWSNSGRKKDGETQEPSKLTIIHKEIVTFCYRQAMTVEFFIKIILYHG
jgi:hypothetical protein